MNDETLSPDGAWRWDGQRWVPNQAPPLPTSPQNPFVVPALFAGMVGLIPVVVQLVGDTIRAFGNRGISGPPWYFDTWFVVLAFLLGALALALASLAALRNPSGLTAVAMAIAGGVFVQGSFSLYYRVIVSHFGYDVPLF